MQLSVRATGPHVRNERTLNATDLGEDACGGAKFATIAGIVIGFALIGIMVREAHCHSHGR